MDVKAAMRVISEQQERIKALEVSNLQKDLIIEPYSEFVMSVPITIPNRDGTVTPMEWLDWAKKELGYGKKKSSL
jgi:hypothetical protein